MVTASMYLWLGADVLSLGAALVTQSGHTAPVNIWGARSGHAAVARGAIVGGIVRSAGNGTNAN